MGAWEATDPNTGDGSDADVTLTRYYSAGGVQLASKSTGGSTLITLGDVQGSAQVTVDASGAVTRNAYTPYGTKRAGSNVASAHGWLNQIADADTGLTYLNARYYDPALGRFLSPDPLLNPGDPRTLDPYRYADNNPVVYMDATGLNPGCGVLVKGTNDACFASYGTATSPLRRMVQSFTAIIAAKVRSAKFSTGRPRHIERETYGKGADEIMGAIHQEVAWRIGRMNRRASEGAEQNAFDDKHGTSRTETLMAMSVIWQDGAKYHAQGIYCGKVMECFTGANFEFGARTAGHTVITKDDDLTATVERHEYDHVRDFAGSGANKFYPRYVAGYVVGMWTAVRHPDRMIEQYERLYPTGDDSAAWFWKVSYALNPKEVAAREAEAAG